MGPSLSSMSPRPPPAARPVGATVLGAGSASTLVAWQSAPDLKKRGTPTHTLLPAPFMPNRLPRLAPPPSRRRIKSGAAPGARSAPLLPRASTGRPDHLNVAARPRDSRRAPAEAPCFSRGRPSARRRPASLVGPEAAGRGKKSARRGPASVSTAGGAHSPNDQAGPKGRGRRRHAKPEIKTANGRPRLRRGTRGGKGLEAQAPPRSLAGRPTLLAGFHSLRRPGTARGTAPLQQGLALRGWGRSPTGARLG